MPGLSAGQSFSVKVEGRGGLPLAVNSESGVKLPGRSHGGGLGAADGALGAARMDEQSQVSLARVCGVAPPTMTLRSGVTAGVLIIR